MTPNVTTFMQVFAAYALFAVSLVALVLSIVGAAMIVMAIYEGVVWARMHGVPHSLRGSRLVRDGRSAIIRTETVR